MRLIDADALADALFDKRKNYPQWVADTIGEMPDAVVRCKDCKWSWHINPNEDTPFYVCQNPMLCNMRISHEGDWHCGDGELKDGEQE